MTGYERDAARNVLVLRPGALGDLVLVEPVVRALHGAGRRVLLAASGWLVPLARACLGADEGLDFDAPPFSRLFGGEPLDSFGRFDAAVAYLGRDAVESARRLAAAGVRDVVLAETRPAEGSGIHAAEHLASALGQLGVQPPSPAVPRIHVQPAPIADLARPALAVHPGAGSARKRWPAERLAEVASRWRGEKGGGVALIEGEADAEAARAFEAACPPDAHLAGRPLPEVAAVLAAADAYLGNDSGVTHLAAAAGARTVALFGPTDPALWAPRGERVTVLAAPSGEMVELAVERAAEALGLSASP